MIIENLFPKPIGFFHRAEEITKKQENFILSQEKRNNDGNKSSVNKYILKEKEFNDLYVYIEKCAHEYFMATYNPKNDVRLKITQSWLNWTEKDQFHHKHAHPNSLISGCFYLNADKKNDKIHFFKEEYKQINFPPIDWNHYNSNSWWFPVGKNDLIFFPSSLTHMVQTVESAETRISLAFNTFPMGSIGDEADLTALYL